MKKYLFIISLFVLFGCTKQFETPIQENETISNEFYYGYKAFLVKYNDLGNYIIYAETSETSFLIYPNVLKSNVRVVRSSKKDPYFYTNRSNANDHILELPYDFVIKTFTH